MNIQDPSSDILVVHQNRIIFSSGQGRLTKNSKISATVAQVLTLFSQKIMAGEQLHFIRFEKHRMIFLFSQEAKEDSMVAIVLIPIDRNAKQVIPAMSIILRSLEEFLQGNILDVQNRQLDCFFQILFNPHNSLIVVPRTAEGILAALVIITAFAHDLRFGIQQICSNLRFVDPHNFLDLQEIVQRSSSTRILSFVYLPEVEENDNVLLFGLESSLRQYFSAFPGEQIYDVISRIFGDQSNAGKMKTFIANEEAREIAQSISLFPSSEDEFIKKEILLSTVLQPGRDIIVTMSTPVMKKLRELASSSTAIKKPLISNVDQESFTIGSQLVGKTEIQHMTPSSEVALNETVELSAEPDAIPIKHQVIEPEIIESIQKKDTSTVDTAQLEELRGKGFEYQFNSIPLTLDTTPLVSSIPETEVLPINESNITIRLFPRGYEHFSIHIYCIHDRLSSLKDSIKDISDRIGGEIHQRENHIQLLGMNEKLKTAVRGLLWLSVVEYLSQVKMKTFSLAVDFDIPKEGSILIIPPDKNYIQDKIPSKFKYFVEETEIRNKNEQEAIWTLGKTQDEILSLLMKPLKQGDGVVFVAANNNQEMEEIALFLLLVSEVCGIGFSRW
ncbi:MAG: hypothetical protein ACXAC8_12625 [Candidatus Hodarchaeales archaeon]|jgi:hypothetical protein